MYIASGILFELSLLSKFGLHEYLNIKNKNTEYWFNMLILVGIYWVFSFILNDLLNVF